VGAVGESVGTAVGLTVGANVGALLGAALGQWHSGPLGRQRRRRDGGTENGGVYTKYMVHFRQIQRLGFCGGCDFTCRL
jgi:hypothetical protein